MAHRVLALALVLVGVLAYPLAAPAGASGPPPPPGFKQFVSSRDHYRLLYPDSWSQQFKSGTQYFNGPVVGGFKTNVNVVLLSGARGVSTAALRTLVAGAYRHDGATLEQTTAIRVAGHSGWWIAGRFSKKISGRLVHDRFATVTFIARTKVWEITLSTAPSAFTGTAATFRIMIRSFAFT